MNQKEIAQLQERIGAKPDGIFGPLSRKACIDHLTALMPKPSPWPKSNESAMVAFYGKPGDESNLVNLDVRGIGVFYDGTLVRSIRCHRLVAQSLRLALEEISCGPAAWILTQYAGCYMNRPMRGGTRPSKHAWGAAIDLAPSTNGLRMKWPQESTMPLEAMEAFAKQGWTGLGWEIWRDSMHFQACCPF